LSPFILFWVCYDLMRGVADSVVGRVHVEAPFRAEQLLLGWLTTADIPAAHLQRFQADHAGTIIKHVLDVTSAMSYSLHLVIPFLVAWLFWHTLNERRNFYLYVSTFTVLNAMALITFMIYPTAPPWYVAQYGFAQPSHVMLDSAAALVNFDRLIGHDVFLSLYATFNSNPFAAIPSLHAGYPTIIALLVGLRFGGWAWLAVLLPAWAWFSAVYLNHHYIVDLLVGGLYAMIAFLIARLVIVPQLCDRIVDYGTTSRLLLEGSKR
jgi:inositol phosphorylceramide synthase catalytic subunit